MRISPIKEFRNYINNKIDLIDLIDFFNLIEESDGVINGYNEDYWCVQEQIFAEWMGWDE